MKRYSWFVPLLILLVSSSLLLAQKRAFTLDDLYRLKGVGDVQIRPDGKKIAFVVTEFFLHKGKRNSDIYVMDADGSHLRQLTRSEAADYHPRWSPDGKTLLFVSTRNEGPQAWLLPLEGGEPRQLTHVYTGVSNPTWTPDGKKIVFSSSVFPECGADDDCNKKIAENLKEGPVQAHLADRLFYRHWNFWKDGKRTHTFVFDLESETVTDLTPGDYDAPSFSLGGGNGFAISPDGTELCYVSNHDTNAYETTNKDLWVVPLTGGKAVNLTDENEAYDGDPVYSPDGRYIAYRMQTVPGYESDRFRLAVYDRKNREKIVLTEDFDYWVGEIQWAPDSRTLYFTAEVKGHVPLFRVSLKERKVRQVVDLKTIDQFQIAPNGRWLALLRRSVGEPREVWRCNRNGQDVKRLSFFNKPVEEEVDIRPAEEMWIPSPTGKKIHTFVVKPHNFDPSKKYPLILNVHGGPQGMWADAFRGDWQMYPGAGYIVAFPNPHGSVGYGQDFTAAISRDWGGKVYQDVMAVADSLARLPYVDANRMGAMGWSYGGYMMMWLEGHTTRFKAIAAMMGVYNLTSFYGETEELWFPQWDLGGAPWESPDYEKWSPHKFVKNFKTPCLVITGEKDFRVSYTESLQFFTALQKMGVPSRLIVFKNDGHWPDYVKSMPLYYDAHLDWFHRWLGGAPAPYDVLKMVRNQAYERAEADQ